MSTDATALTMVLEGLARLEKGQDEIRSDLRLLRDADQQQHKRISDLELKAAERTAEMEKHILELVAENRRLSEVADARQQESIDTLKEQGKGIRTLVYRLAGSATLLGGGAVAGHIPGVI